MSTRSRAKPESAAAVKATANSQPKRTRKGQVSTNEETVDIENKVKSVRKKVVADRKTDKGARGKAKANKEYCICKGVDDGTPMVNCSECKDWFHFRCIDLSERDAEDISVYVCSSCTEKTGRRTVMEWEGPDALEEVSPDAKHSPAPPSDPPSEPEEVASGSDDADSEDEYVVADKVKGSGRKRVVRRLSLSSEEDSSQEEGQGKKRSRRVTTKASTSPSPQLKRKSQATGPPAKRKKSESTTDDPTRKYCLGQLQVVFTTVFLKYPHFEGRHKQPDELSEEERSHLTNQAHKFADELEQCIYDTYSESEAGKSGAGGKYKERFRMLQFNLSKPDRVAIHKRIASFNITAKELSLMSSTDLANEETKQSIKAAEKEALEHSILQKTKAPRAKITHKGLQDIEEVNMETGSSRDIEDQEEEEKRERERRERLRATQAQAQQRRASINQSSVPPDSPVVPQTPTWGAPPPLPGNTGELSGRPHASPLFVHTASDFSVPTEPELKLADLINIDEELSPQEASAPAPLPASPTRPPGGSSSPTSAVFKPISPVTATGISPFAAATTAKPELSAKPSSFDLNSLWTAPKVDEPARSVSPRPQPVAQEGPKDGVMDHDSHNQEADDQDFDMFLDEKDDKNDGGSNNSTEAQQAAFDNLSQVWSGKVGMPLDSTIPQETPVFARQVGGRTIDSDSVLWKTLFPSDLLRIDGRVPTDKSSQFLLQMRMTSAKELIAVAFSPASTEADAGFRILMDFLIAKNRHGLVFPWGSRPKEHHPGKELYIIPLLSSDPLPDYMELLDELRLPKIRKLNCLVGIWVLTKGKLVPPAPVPNSTPLVPSTSAVNHLPPSLPQSITIPPPPPGPAALHNAAHLVGLLPQVNPAIAAEVATLTPEQVQLMLQTLAASQPLPIPSVSPPQPQPSHASPSQTAIPPQAWANPPSNFSRPYASTNHQSPPHPPPHDPYPPHSPYDRGSRGQTNDRGWQGEHSRGRGRGRGRGGRDYRDDGPRKPIDSGWPRRNRSDGAGSTSNPGQSRWGPPSQWS